MFENSGRIVDASGTDASAILDGFFIRAGYGLNAPFDQGGGLYMANGSPTIRNCTFQYNSYGNGASVFIDGGAPVFEGCVIRDGYNFARTASGVYAQSTQVQFVDCQFINHYTVTMFGGNDGSAFFGDWNTTSSFLRCEFVDNQIGNWFAMGDSSGSFGAGIYSLGNLTVDSCTFSGGFGNGGSAIAAHGVMAVSNSLFYDNFARPYPITSYISDGDAGAAIYTWGSGGSLEVDSCTFVDNYCDKGAGVFGGALQPVVVRNSILFFNDGPVALPGEDQTPRVKRQFTGNVQLENCDVEELWVKLALEDPIESGAYPGCFDQDPQFVSWQTGDLHLLADSPCLNSGDAALLPPGVTVDLDGNPRLQGSALDMGCYESSLTPQPSLTATSFITEVDSVLNVWNALPGETVYLAYSFQGLGAGPSIPQLGGLSLGILSPVSLFQVLVADNAGHAVYAFTVPPSAPLVDIYFQAAVARGQSGAQSVVTNALAQHIYLKP